MTQLSAHLEHRLFSAHTSNKATLLKERIAAKRGVLEVKYRRMGEVKARVADGKKRKEDM